MFKRAFYSTMALLLAAPALAKVDGRVCVFLEPKSSALVRST